MNQIGKFNKSKIIMWSLVCIGIIVVATMFLIRSENKQAFDKEIVTAVNNDYGLYADLDNLSKIYTKEDWGIGSTYPPVQLR